MVLLNKAQIRTHLRKIRQSMTLEARHVASENAAKLLEESILFEKAKNIACYFATSEEFDCTAMIERIWNTNKNCYLPILSATQKNTLEFAQYDPNDTLRLNQHRILEPENTLTIALEKLDLILLPLVGFDPKGHRLGMGAGYYDRTLALLSQNTLHHPILIGIGYSTQQVEQIPRDEWDIPLDGVLTEKELFIFPYRKI